MKEEKPPSESFDNNQNPGHIKEKAVSERIKLGDFFLNQGTAITITSLDGKEISGYKNAFGPYETEKRLFSSEMDWKAYCILREDGKLEPLCEYRLTEDGRIDLHCEKGYILPAGGKVTIVQADKGDLFFGN